MVMGENKKAIDYLTRSLLIAEETGLKRGLVGLQINLGSLYFRQGDYKMALEYSTQGLKGAEEIGSKGQTAHALGQMAEVYEAQKEYKKARDVGERALSLAQEEGNMERVRFSSKGLSSIYKAIGNYQRSMELYELSVLMRDSLNNEENQKAIIQQQFVFDYEKKVLADSLKSEEAKLIVQHEHEKEVHEKEQQRNIMLGSGLGILLLAGGLWSRLRYTKKTKAKIEKEKDRSEELLLNILPEEVAKELKENGTAEAQLIEHVSVLFTDFKGFTAMAEQVSAQELVHELHVCFSEFDLIMQKYGIEKIKTIGDAYMAAGGLPVPTDESVKNTVLAALEMRDFVEAGKAKKIEDGLPYFEIRIGVHTGPVVAGIVGIKKFQYDIWGDTVNTASRIESNGEIGKVNISQATYDLLNDDPAFTFENRGKIEAKGKGEIEMYFVSLR
jgi:class 3 adenylate cyclase